MQHVGYRSQRIVELGQMRLYERDANLNRGSFKETLQSKHNLIQREKPWHDSKVTATCNWSLDELKFIYQVRQSFKSIYNKEFSLQQPPHAEIRRGRVGDTVVHTRYYLASFLVSETPHPQTLISPQSQLPSYSRISSYTRILSSTTICVYPHVSALGSVRKWSKTSVGECSVCSEFRSHPTSEQFAY
jgi:hypothetical protein